MHSGGSQRRGLGRPALLAPFGPQALAFARALGRAGLRPGLIWLTGDGHPPPASRYLQFVEPMSRAELQAEGGPAALAGLLARHGVDGLCCFDEVQMLRLWEQREVFPQVDFWWSGPRTLEQTLSKAAQLAVARQVGLPLLPAWECWLDQPLPDIPEGAYPLCLRPATGHGVLPGFKAEVVRRPAELACFMAGRTRTDVPVIAQPFLDWPNLVIHGARSADGRHLGLAAFLVPRKFEGVTLSMHATPLPGDLAADCEAFVDALDVRGVYHFEFLYDPPSGRAYFLELNPRLGGTTAKALALGYDEPGMLAAAFGAGPVPRWQPSGAVVSNRQALLKCAARALTGRLSPLDHPGSEGRVARVAALAWGLLAWRDEMVSRDDLRGTWSYYGQLLRDKLPGFGR